MSGHDVLWKPDRDMVALGLYQTLRRRIIQSVWNWRLPSRSATQIAHDLGASPASVSSILKKLADNKVVRRDLKKGTWVYS